VVATSWVPQVLEPGLVLVLVLGLGLGLGLATWP
jgi:hypothetical protein